MTGDVLPCFDASLMRLPPHGAVVVTTPAPFDVASRHGVIVPAHQQQTSPSDGSLPAGRGNVEVVARLLQKPRVADMVAQGAVYGSGQALLDTGIFAVTGDTWQGLVRLAAQDPDPVLQVLASGEEVGSACKDVQGHMRRHVYAACASCIFEQCQCQDTCACGTAFLLRGNVTQPCAFLLPLVCPWQLCLYSEPGCILGPCLPRVAPVQTSGGRSPRGTWLAPTTPLPSR